MTQDEIKTQVYEVLQKRGTDGAMLDELADDPSIAPAGRHAIESALEALRQEKKVIGRDPIHGWVAND